MQDRASAFAAPGAARALAFAFLPVALLVLALGGCAHAPRGSGGPSPGGPAAEIGTASYYAAKFEGRRTASGERYDPEALTAAHRTYAFGTRLRVTRLENGRSVEVRVNDRMPQGGSHLLDLSRRAAAELDFLRAGVTRVRIEVVGPAATAPKAASGP